MTTTFRSVRYFLFVHSYSGNKIACNIKDKYRNRKKYDAITTLSNIMNFNREDLANFVLLNGIPDSPFQRLPKDLKIYLEIEKELIKLSEEKLDKYSTTLEDYQRQLFYPAIERAVGNFLTDVKNDDRFQSLLEEKFKQACYIYYKVVCKYKLPTLRTVPFVLRLIT